MVAKYFFLKQRKYVKSPFYFIFMVATVKIAQLSTLDDLKFIFRFIFLIFSISSTQLVRENRALLVHYGSVLKYSVFYCSFFTWVHLESV